MGLRRFRWANRWRARTACSTTTRKRRTCIELRASNGQLAATHPAQPRVSHKPNNGSNGSNGSVLALEEEEVVVVA